MQIAIRDDERENMGALAAITDIDDQAWKLSAACRDLPKDAFYTTAKNEVFALATCRGCPVRPECLEYAIDFEGSDRDRYGVFGGMTAKDRVVEFRRRNPTRKVRRFS